MVQSIDHIELIVRDVDAHITLFEKLGFNVPKNLFATWKKYRY